MNGGTAVSTAVAPGHDEIQQFKKIIELRNRIMGGDHPQFRPPGNGTGQNAAAAHQDASSASSVGNHVENGSGYSILGRNANAAGKPPSKQDMRVERLRIEAVLSRKLHEHNNSKQQRQDTVQEQQFVLNVSEIYDRAMKMAPPRARTDTAPASAAAPALTPPSGSQEKRNEAGDAMDESAEYVPPMEIGEIAASPAPEEQHAPKRVKRDTSEQETLKKNRSQQKKEMAPATTGPNKKRTGSGSSESATIVHNQLTALAAPQAERVSPLTTMPAVEGNAKSAKQAQRVPEYDAQYQPRGHQRHTSSQRGSGEERYYEKRASHDYDRYNVPYGYGPAPVVYASYEYDRRPEGSAEERYGQRPARHGPEASSAAPESGRRPNGTTRITPEKYDRDPQLRYAAGPRAESPFRRHDEPQPQRVYVQAPEVIYVDEYGRPLPNPPRRIVVPSNGAPYEYQSGRSMPMYYEAPPPMYAPQDGYPPPAVVYGRSREDSGGRFEPPYREEDRREGYNGQRPRSVAPTERPYAGHERSPPSFRGRGRGGYQGNSYRPGAGGRGGHGASRGNWKNSGDYGNRQPGPRY